MSRASPTPNSPPSRGPPKNGCRVNDLVARGVIDPDATRQGPLDPTETPPGRLSGTSPRIAHSFAALLIQPVVWLLPELFRVPVEHPREHERVRINRPQQRARRAVRPPAPLLPVPQGFDIDADERGELLLRGSKVRTNEADVQ